MSQKLPQYIPILTAYATRVSGRSWDELIASGGAMARALADTQKAAGHDGVLCVFRPGLLASACAEAASGTPSLRDPEEVSKAASMAVILDAARALRQMIAPNVSVYVCVDGPALTLLGLRQRLGEENVDQLADYEYVGDVFLSVARAALEAQGHGVAVIERLTDDSAHAVGPVYRSVRKLADFYGSPLLLYLLSGSSRADELSSVADCSFALPSGRDPEVAVVGKLGKTSTAEIIPVTTAGDVRPDTPLENLQNLWKKALPVKQLADKL